MADSYGSPLGGRPCAIGVRGCESEGSLSDPAGRVVAITEENLMALTEQQSEDEDLVGVLAIGAVDRAVEASLADLGMTVEELAAEAKRGRFSSDRARLVWLAIRNLAPSA